MHVLGRQANVSHDRQTRRREPLNRLSNAASTFQLYGGSAAFLKNSRRIPHGLLCRHLIRKERHVGNDECAVGATRDSLRMVNDCIESYGNRRVQSQNHMPKGIAHEQDVNAGPVEKPRHGCIVGSQHDDSLAFRLHQGKIRYAELLWYSVHSAVLNISSVSAFSRKPPGFQPGWQKPTSETLIVRILFSPAVGSQFFDTRRGAVGSLPTRPFSPESS